MKCVDICIIGSGPSGLFASFQAGMLGLTNVVIESLESPGGQCSHLYPQKNIYDIPAVQKISGQGLVNALLGQISQFQSVKDTFLLNQKANFLFQLCSRCCAFLHSKDKFKVNLCDFFDKFLQNTNMLNRDYGNSDCDFCAFLNDKNDVLGDYKESTIPNLQQNLSQANFSESKLDVNLLNCKENDSDISSKEFTAYLVKTSSNDWILCKAVVIAAGVGSFEPKRIPMPKITKYEEEFVFYSVKDKEKFRNKDILIIGGGDSALDWCNELSDIANVILVHRRDDFSGVSSTLDKILNKITILKPYTLHDISEVNKDGNMQFDCVLLKNLKTQEILSKKVDYILAFFGLSTSMGDINNWNLVMGTKNRIVTSATTSETSRKMVYAIGDCATNGKVSKLIATGFDEASQAVHDVYHKLYPGQRIDYSTTKFDK